MPEILAGNIRKDEKYVNIFVSKEVVVLGDPLSFWGAGREAPVPLLSGTELREIQV